MNVEHSVAYIQLCSAFSTAIIAKMYF